VSLKITHDGEAENALCERCCMCREPTHYWHASDVALCPDCAKTTKRVALPTKKDWCAKEAKLAHRRFGY